MIRVIYKGQIVDPILLTDFNNTTPGLAKNLNVSQCGSNIYFYTNYTVSFVVTEDIDCVITVEVTDTIQLTTHFAMNISDFFNSNTSVTNFINNLCALLNIVDTSRVKIVGVFSGSTTITTTVTDSINSTTNSTDPSLSSINSTLNTIISNGTFSANMSKITGFGTVIGVTSVYSVINPTNSSSGSDANGPQNANGMSSSSSKVGLIVGVATAGVVLVIGALVTFVYCARRRGKVTEKIVSN